VDRPEKDCFAEISELLESLGALRLRLIEGPGEYRSATWRLHGSNISMTVTRQDDGVVTVQTNKGVPMRGKAFLRKTLAAIGKLAASPVD
jgi:hypothetical protein